MKLRNILFVMIIVSFVLGGCAPAATQAPEATQPVQEAEATTEVATTEEAPADVEETTPVDSQYPDDGIEYDYPNPPEYDMSKVNMDYDGRIITITLRPEAQWSNGTPITSRIGSSKMLLKYNR